VSNYNLSLADEYVGPVKPARYDIIRQSYSNGDMYYLNFAPFLVFLRARNFLHVKMTHKHRDYKEVNNG
jgi:hypothetical protein